MPSTLLLDRVTWDLTLDAAGNIAVATEPYALGQDAASAIRTFESECYWNTSVGVPYLSQILARRPPLALLKQFFIDAALTVPNVVSTQVFITGLSDRALTGQVQVVSANGQVSTPVPFTVINPQGTG